MTATKHSKSRKAAATSAAKRPAAPINPLIDEYNPLDTLSNVKGVMTFLSFAVPNLIREGSNDEATNGLTIILECATQAIDHATRALQPKGVRNG
jgi:hypothetical protein